MARNMTVTDPENPDPLNDPRTTQADPGAYGQGADLASTGDEPAATGDDELAAGATEADAGGGEVTGEGLPLTGGVPAAEEAPSDLPEDEDEDTGGLFPGTGGPFAMAPPEG
jgi:hypothetical protein